MTRYFLQAIFIFIFLFNAASQQKIELGLLKYKGGGDWYANPTSLPNLARFCNQKLGTEIKEDYVTVESDDPNIFNYPFIHLTGHGNIEFSSADIKNLREYLMGGGFLHIDDNYGLNKYIRPQMKLAFPELDFIELPYSHPIYHQKYDFNKGLPKIHEHDSKAPQGFGLIYEGRLICFYSYECDLSDGWEDPDVHKDSEKTRLQALQMGANIIQFVFGQ